MKLFCIIALLLHQSVSILVSSKLKKLIKEESEAIQDRKLQHHLEDSSSFDFFNYHNLSEIYTFLDQIQDQDLITIDTIGHSHQGNPIPVAKLSLNSSIEADPSKKIIILECGIHASEWISPAFCLYVIDRLLELAHHGPLKYFDFVLVPLLNPDGYAYSWKHARLWRKNRRPRQCTEKMAQQHWTSYDGLLFHRKDGTECYGIDLNRNFNISFGNAETNQQSSNADFIYEGPEPFSEYETLALKSTLESLNGSKRIISYLAIHAYSQFWLLPYGFKDTKSPHHADLTRVAYAATQALQSVHSTYYSIGTSRELVYPVNGSSQDWVHEVLGVKYVYTLELRPHFVVDEYPAGFILPVRDIQPTLEETWSGLNAMSEAILSNGGVMKRPSFQVALTGLFFFYKCSANTKLF